MPQPSSPTTKVWLGLSVEFIVDCSVFASDFVWFFVFVLFLFLFLFFFVCLFVCHFLLVCLLFSFHSSYLEDRYVQGSQMWSDSSETRLLRNNRFFSFRPQIVFLLAKYGASTWVNFPVHAFVHFPSIPPPPPPAPTCLHAGSVVFLRRTDFVLLSREQSARLSCALLLIFLISFLKTVFRY